MGVLECWVRGDAVGEFEVGTVEEAKIGEIGKEAVAGSIEREIEGGGLVMETIVGNIEKEIDVVDIDIETNEGTGI
ncbi:Hypothetical predicted protein [Olea europaea subsp. europaea]|uniref:Uncharacterized protein n=1 Tax=Olea europaea subsp. europaea TaxID=158383 RepID=A0A8S0QZR2_OLEEU|nr:Hypothetical predicted protein [Olea europaea subsp. europaea]